MFVCEDESWEEVEREAESVRERKGRGERWLWIRLIGDQQTEGYEKSLLKGDL